MYNNFAYVYDKFMSNVNYNEWVDYIESIYKKYSINPSLTCELGCGTGNITTLLKNKGYDVIGIDNSVDMLSVAMEKDSSILYLNQDMTDFELYGTVDVFLSICDSLNYITEIDDLNEVFKLVNLYLNPGGYFIFDLNTEYKFKEILGDNTFAESLDDSAYIWDNFYDEEDKINEYQVDFFIKDNNNTYSRFSETHFEKSYSVNEIKNIINKNNLSLVNIFDSFTFNEPKNESERLYFIVRKEK